MIWALLLVGGLWFAGRRLGISARTCAFVLAVLYIGVLLGQFVLPRDNAMRVALGGGPAPWLMLGGVVALILIYGKGIAALRARADPAQATQSAATTVPAALFSETELNRYARHIVLRELGGPGQKALKQARVLVIGAGGLGSPALLYLAAAGVGTIGVIDDDLVDNSNLQRQVIHRDADIDTPKVHSAARAMRAQNPFVTVLPYQRRLSPDIAADLLGDFDVILDGTDNFDTRYLANRIAVATGKPLISGALSQWEGQLSVFSPRHGTPCYECIFPVAPAPGLAPSCAEAGVLSPLPGVLGSMMAVEAVKLISGAGAPLLGEMLIYDALWGETRKIALKPRPDCPVCGAIHEVSE
ncbi:molybdopterin-synthase adenylyltransferase MoeB [Pseudooceanicola sediminis]|uniref:Molybdopterin-synthase adenylyltransferase n=1 Tax=Pseudooceanicola sediminis TaxID=2211117 RepID=A0A399J7K6_9RHOB|nr:molybdopterin-synthase adenylyltransferase MoeB [Pseudooceanicola sediminis]KAA2314168.1 molybdopterin-synthase adenylyltransferase MoeB [Puniceibacterium sp. HSS470]RII39972.1 molybdopterin-synthase adenylyltransferase MoeB [Pseudooceanicola sediminis]|tara:strand:+ start:27981 stop:29048 length:1068 start_codon:yes stop_codon:yes gene_type:complete